MSWILDSANATVFAMPTLWHKVSANLLDASVTAAVLGIVGRAFWHLGGLAGRTMRFYLGQAVAQFPVEFGPFALPDDPLRAYFLSAKVYCQIVRFGDDDYIQHMASEQEKFEGRLQNRVMPVTMAMGPGGYQGHMLLPVHRRLGTQFKMFLMAGSSDEARSLMDSPIFVDPERHARRRGRRISFVVKDIQKVGNVEGQSFNNICYPSNLHDFPEHNAFGPVYIAVQRWRFKWSQRR